MRGKILAVARNWATQQMVDGQIDASLIDDLGETLAAAFDQPGGQWAAQERLNVAVQVWHAVISERSVHQSEEVALLAAFTAFLQAVDKPVLRVRPEPESKPGPFADWYMELVKALDAECPALDPVTLLHRTPVQRIEALGAGYRWAMDARTIMADTVKRLTADVEGLRKSQQGTAEVNAQLSRANSDLNERAERQRNTLERALEVERTQGKETRVELEIMRTMLRKCPSTIPGDTYPRALQRLTTKIAKLDALDDRVERVKNEAAKALEAIGVEIIPSNNFAAALVATFEKATKDLLELNARLTLQIGKCNDHDAEQCKRIEKLERKLHNYAEANLRAYTTADRIEEALDAHEVPRSIPGSDRPRVRCGVATLDERVKLVIEQNEKLGKLIKTRDKDCVNLQQRWERHLQRTLDNLHATLAECLPPEAFVKVEHAIDQLRPIHPAIPKRKSQEDAAAEALAKLPRRYVEAADMIIVGDYLAKNRHGYTGPISEVAKWVARDERITGWTPSQSDTELKRDFEAEALRCGVQTFDTVTEPKQLRQIARDLRYLLDEQRNHTKQLHTELNTAIQAHATDLRNLFDAIGNARIYNPQEPCTPCTVNTAIADIQELTHQRDALQEQTNRLADEVMPARTLLDSLDAPAWKDNSTQRLSIAERIATLTRNTPR